MDSIIERVLLVNFAAIHTSSNVSVYTIFNYRRLTYSSERHACSLSSCGGSPIHPTHPGRDRAYRQGRGLD